MNETQLKQLVRQIVSEVVRYILGCSLGEIFAMLDSPEVMNNYFEIEKTSVGEKNSIAERKKTALITEEDVRKTFQSGQKVILIQKGTIVTPLARDAVNELGMQLRTMEVR